MKKILRIIAVSLIMFVSGQTYAWPERPVTLVLSVSPGGGTDILARSLQEPLSRDLNQPIQIVYKPGGAGLLALRYVLEKQDDHVVLFTTTDQVIQCFVIPCQQIDHHDIAPISLLTRSALVLATKPDNENRNFKNTIALLKQGKKVTFGSPGVGSVSHLVLEKMLPKLTENPVIVHYKGGNPMALDTVAGHTDLSISSYGGTHQPFLDNKQLVASVVFSEKRLAKLPDVPTARELGINIVASVSNSVFAHQSMSMEKRQILHKSFTKALLDSDIKNTIHNRGNEIIAGSPKDLQEFIKSESTLWHEFIKKAQTQ